MPRVPYEISLALIFEIGNDLNIYCPVNADTVRNYLSVIRPPPLSCVCAHLEANKRGFPFGPVKEPAEALFQCLLSDNCNQDCLVLNVPPRFQLPPPLAALSARCSLLLPSPSGYVYPMVRVEAGEQTGLCLQEGFPSAQTNQLVTPHHNHAATLDLLEDKLVPNMGNPLIQKTFSKNL